MLVLSQQGFTASDVVELYLHRGAFESQLSDEDQEIDPDRWCSHTACGQEAWCIVSQWIWNLRLELGHQVEPTPERTTEFASALSPQSKQTAASSISTGGYGQLTTATTWKTGRFSGQDFPLQPDGTLRCPAGSALLPHEWRREADGSLRVVYGASIRSCRPCPLREQCQWKGSTTKKPRQVSVLLHPLAVGNASLLWHDWGRRTHRRACIHLLRHQCVEVELAEATPPAQPPPVRLLSRTERAHYRLTWAQRLVRNARPETAGQVTIRLFGVPEHIAASLSWAVA
jgi:hypothetical protein